MMRTLIEYNGLTGLLASTDISVFGKEGHTRLNGSRGL